jgi:hypothetical protein
MPLKREGSYQTTSLELAETVRLNESKNRFHGKQDLNQHYQPIKTVLPPLGLNSSRLDESSASTSHHASKTSRASHTKQSTNPGASPKGELISIQCGRNAARAHEQANSSTVSNRQSKHAIDFSAGVEALISQRSIMK